MADLSRRARGRWGEDRAVAHLRRLGFEIVDRNWRSPEREVGGELDVVAAQGPLLVFCEVKARRRSGYGGAVAAVDERKQERIRALAACWLRVRAWPVDEVRFDVITIDGVTLRHHRAAF
jgi:putative endonuclease